MKNFKHRYNITSNAQLLVILLVFAITGSSSALLVKPILEFFGILKTSISILLYYFLYFIFLFPVYQILLLSFGKIFGQFPFFLKFELKMLRSLHLHFIANFLENKFNV